MKWNFLKCLYLIAFDFLVFKNIEFESLKINVSKVSSFYNWKHNWNIHYELTESIENNGRNSIPLLLIPGFGVGTFHFERNVEMLAEDGYRVYTFDLLGQGKSWPHNGIVEKEHGLSYSVINWRDQIIHFISEIIAEPAHLAGNSLGGYLAVTVASTRPDLVKSVILMNPTPFWGFINPKKKNRVEENEAGSIWNGVLPAPSLLLKFGSNYFNTLRNRRTVSSMLNFVYADSQAFDDELVSNIIDSASHPGGPSAFTSILFSPKYHEPFDKMIQSLRSPICLIMGMNDPWIVPYWGQRFKRIRNDTLYLELSQTGHCPHHESPQTVNYILSTWLQTLHMKKGGTQDRSHEMELQLREQAIDSQQLSIEEFSYPIHSSNQMPSDPSRSMRHLDPLFQQYLHNITIQEHSTREVEVKIVDGKPRTLWEQFLAKFEILEVEVD